MRILLIYPEFPDTFWSFKHALKFIRKKAGSPPLGLLTVSAMLPDTWEKQLVDLNVTDLTSKDLAWADYVFISAMTVQHDAARADFSARVPSTKNPVSPESTLSTGLDPLHVPTGYPRG